MGDELRLIVALGLATGVALVVVPLARRVAVATSFYDHPVGYKAHSRATPYLGGAGVFLAFLIGALVLGEELSRFDSLIAGAAVLLVVGTLDDRVGLGVIVRFTAQIAAAVGLWATDAGWQIFGDGIANLIITVFWVVGLVNAFNMLDNIDGSTGTVGGVAAAGVGLVAIGRGDPVLAAFAMALAGACLGFLRFNLATPSRIFLGDGGSMPVGLLVAGIVMALPQPDYGWVTLLAAAPLAGVAIFDTALVVVSRLRRGTPVLSGARDHVSHRALSYLHTPQRVALFLGGAQALLSALAALLYGLSLEAVLIAGGAYIGLAMGAILALETSLPSPQPATDSQR